MTAGPKSETWKQSVRKTWQRKAAEAAPVGAKFGLWTVTSAPYHLPDSSTANYVVDVVCQCGATQVLRTSELRSGRHIGCRDCAHRVATSRRKARTLRQYTESTPVGAKFGLWTVTSAPFSRPDGNIRVEVQCACGASGTVPVAQLHGRHSRSCRACADRHHAVINQARAASRAPVGAKFGKWTVTSAPRLVGDGYVVEVTCDCGTVRELSVSGLVRTRGGCRTCCQGGAA